MGNCFSSQLPRPNDGKKQDSQEISNRLSHTLSFQPAIQDSVPPLNNSKTSSTESTVRTVLGCYQSGTLVKEFLPLNDVEYIAISHTWGLAEWQHVRGIDDEVLVSDEKAKFIADRLPSIVGGSYFWMDVLCVDQRDDEARVAITQLIPLIFREAKLTIVIQEGTGFRNCCIRLIDNFSWLYSAEDHDLSTLELHYDTNHTDEMFCEGALTRLWLLQEMLLSDTIRFVRCEQEAVVRKRTTTMLPFREDILEPLRDLSILSIAWSMYGDPDGDERRQCRRSRANCCVPSTP